MGAHIGVFVWVFTFVCVCVHLPFTTAGVEQNCCGFVCFFFRSVFSFCMLVAVVLGEVHVAPSTVFLCSLWP